MKHNEEVTSSDISKLINKTLRTAQRELKTLISKGFVYRTGITEKDKMEKYKLKQ